MSALSREGMPRIPSFTPFPEEESDSRAKNVFQGTVLAKRGFRYEEEKN